MSLSNGSGDGKDEEYAEKNKDRVGHVHCQTSNRAKAQGI
jgi:hypothetical protein